MSNIQPIFIQVIRKPERLCIIKRGRCAEDYFPYCEEVSCDVWGMLMSMRSLCGEPVAMWLPEKYKKPGTSTYVQGVEAEPDDPGIVPEGFDTIHLPEAEYLMFQGPAFVLGVELAMYVVYCLVSLATLAAAALSCGVRLRGSLPGFLGISPGSDLPPICVMLALTALCTLLSLRFFRWE